MVGMISRTVCLIALLAGMATAAPTEKEWKSLFDGKSLGGWVRTNFAAGANVRVDPKFRGGDPAIVVEMGDTLNGFNWKVADDKKETAALPDPGKTPAKPFEIPKTNYEISLEVMKIDGNDFPLGLTFPVGDSYASLILGGWGGAVVGISSIDNLDASENETTKYLTIAKDKWYKVRMRVTPDKLQAWMDDKPIVDVKIAGRKISLRSGEISKSVPLGISTFQTTAAFRDLKIRRLDPNEVAAKPQ